MKKFIKGEFIFDYAHLLYCECHKINPNSDRSYIDSPERKKTQKETINPINKKDISIHCNSHVKL